MNYIKYFQNTNYELDKNDCWTFLQEVYYDEHALKLPNHPIMTDKAEIASNLTSNIPYRIVDKAHKGCIIYYHNGSIHHAGYALDEKKYIHKTRQRVEVSDIPQKAIIYEVLSDTHNT